MKKSDSPYKVKILDKTHNTEMLDIINASPIESGGIKICFAREPDVFKLTELKYNPAKYIGIFKEEKLLGFGLIAYYKGYVNGNSKKVFHLANAYMLKEFRKIGLFLKTNELFFGEVSENAHLGYAVIMKGNKNAERFIGWQSEKYPSIPYSSILGTLDVKNILITFKKKESKIKVRKAIIADIDKIVLLLQKEFSNRLFAPYIDKKEFTNNLKDRPNFSISNYYIAEKENEILGVCAAWDCSSFKQINVLEYMKQFRIVKNVFTLLSVLFGFPPLPEKGKAFKTVYITDCAIKGRNSLILNALIRKIYNEYRNKKFNTMVFGSYENDDLLNATRGFFTQSLKSNIVILHKDKSVVDHFIKTNTYPYIDVALL